MENKNGKKYLEIDVSYDVKEIGIISMEEMLESKGYKTIEDYVKDNGEDTDDFGEYYEDSEDYMENVNKGIFISEFTEKQKRAFTDIDNAKKYTTGYGYTVRPYSIKGIGMEFIRTVNYCTAFMLEVDESETFNPGKLEIIHLGYETIIKYNGNTYKRFAEDFFEETPIYFLNGKPFGEYNKPNDEEDEDLY